MNQNRRAGLLAAALCTTGLISAGALAFELNRPLVPAPQAEVQPGWPHMDRHSVLEAAPPDPVIELAPVVIISSYPAATTRLQPIATAEEEQPQAIGFRCGPERALEQGLATQTVRLCE